MTSTTITWENGVAASFDTASAWVGGVVPNAADTAVISSLGDPAPTLNALTGVLDPVAGESLAVLAKTPLDEATLHTALERNGETETYFTCAAKAARGETIGGGTIDLLGAGSEAGLFLQNSTVKAATKLNVSGDAYLYGGYTNALDGTINIGLPFDVNGEPITAPAADANTFRNAVYLDVQGWGSWTSTDVASGYVPSVTNNGTINVAAASSLYVALAGEATDLVQMGDKQETLLPPENSSFVNDGAIKVAAGGSIHAVSNGGLGSFINDGTVTLSGAAGEKTGGGIAVATTGTGLFVADGGTQTEQAQTILEFDKAVAGVSFQIDDAELWLNSGLGLDTVPSLTCSGGTVTFAGGSGLLLIEAPESQPITQTFTDTIAGFAATDTIELNYTLLPVAGETKWQPGFSISGNTLTIYNDFTTSTGTTQVKEAVFSFAGAVGPFDVAGAWNQSSGQAATVTITTSQAASAQPTRALSGPAPRLSFLASAPAGHVSSAAGVDFAAAAHLALPDVAPADAWSMLDAAALRDPAEAPFGAACVHDLLHAADHAGLLVFAHQR